MAMAEILNQDFYGRPQLVFSDPTIANPEASNNYHYLYAYHNRYMVVLKPMR